MTDSAPPPHHDGPPPSETAGLFPDHPHHVRTEERLAKLERRSEFMMLGVIIAFVLAIGFALLTYSTHVNW